MVLPVINHTVYELVSTQLYLDNYQIFDVLENIVIMAIIPICSFVVVVVATAATVVQLKRAITWRQRASANVDGTEVARYMMFVAIRTNRKSYCSKLRVAMVYFCFITEQQISVTKEYLNAFKNLLNLTSHPLLCKIRSVSRNGFKYMVPHVSVLGPVVFVLFLESQSDCFYHKLISEKAFDFGFMCKSFSV